MILKSASFSFKRITLLLALDAQLIKLTMFLFWIFCFVLGCLSPSTTGNTAVYLLTAAGLYQIIRQFTFLIGAKLFLKKHSQSQKRLTNKLSRAELPLVSILVPSFNEEDVIQNTLNSLLELEYPHIEILVIDDGSTDKTAQKVQEYEVLNPGIVKLIKKANSGKASSLNRGLAEAQGEFLLCVDADSKIKSDSLNVAIPRMLENTKCAALAGVVSLDTHNSMLLLQQQLEYSVGNLQKAFLALFGKTNIVPGPIGLFRKDVLLKLGGYTEGRGSYAEDTELTLRLIGFQYEVSFEPSMISLTQAPRDWQNLMRQRYRWTRGTYQAVFQVLPTLLASVRRGDKVFGAFLFSEQIVAIALEFGALLYCMACVFVYGEFNFFSVYLLALIICDLLVVSVAMQGQSTVLKSIIPTLVCRFSYSVLLLVWKVFSLYEEWRSVGMNWDKVSRYNSSVEPLISKRRCQHA